jgi:hypothetical protein
MIEHMGEEEVSWPANFPEVGDGEGSGGGTPPEEEVTPPADE